MEGRWRGVPAIAVAVVGCLCAVVAAGCSDESPDAERSVAVAPVVTTTPAVTFAPLVQLHPDESSFPISVERFLERASLKWANGDCLVLDDVATGRIADRKTAAPVPRLDAARLGGSDVPYRQRSLDRSCERREGPAYPSTDLTRPYDDGPRSAGLAADEGFYLDLLSDSYDGDPVTARAGGAVDVPAYYGREAIDVDGRPGLRVTYWLLYAHSESPGVDGESVAFHEGDWERVQVLLKRRAQGRWIPVEIGFESQEARLRTVPWSDVERSGSHPVVFSARDSHTGYALSGVHRRRSVDDRAATAIDEAATCDRCPAWRTWVRLRPLRAQPWHGFGGGWGLSSEASETSGPLGPRPAG
jgi:hypothetical protein